MLEVTNLLSGEGIRWVGQSMVTNFSGFTPLGTVLVALLGVGSRRNRGCSRRWCGRWCSTRRSRW
jgi:aminobenzoyl-glutamate transport protein